MPENTSTSFLDLTRPGIIEASAGTGKTFAIAEIFLALLRGEKTYPARGNADITAAPSVKEILAVTFTEAATAELTSRLRKKIREALATCETDSPARDALRLAEAEFDEASVFTIHGFCVRMMKEFGIESSRIKDIRANSYDERLRFATRWRARKIAAGEEIWFQISPEEISNLLEKPLGVPVPPQADDALGNALFTVVAEALPEWRECRKRARDITHDETLTSFAEALKKNPALAARISSRFRIAIVDEFQDTDSVQWEIFRKIFLERERPIFCVGDPKQAIYEFRGGDIRAYRAARNEIREKSGGNALVLEKNWRSSPAMIDAFNEIFSCDAEIADELNARAYKTPRKLKAKLGGLLEYAPVAFPPERADAFPAEDRDVPAAVLRIFEEESSKERGVEHVAECVVDDVCTLVRERGVPAQRIAVLVSKNDEANLYRELFTQRGIPVSTTARGNVLCEPIALALADIVRSMLEPQNTARFRRALFSPFFGDAGEKILLGNDDSADEERIRQAFFEAHAQWEREGFLPAFRRLSGALGFFRTLAERADAEKLVTNVRHLSEILHAEERGRGISPRALTEIFEKKIANADPADESDALQLRTGSDRAAVSVLTVHKSKGLEFDIVFVPSLWARTFTATKRKFVKGETQDGVPALFFSTKKTEDKPDEFLRALFETECENSAALFYVALTRARSRLVLSHVPQMQKGSVWNSYQCLLLRACGIERFGDEGTALPHWKIISEDDPLPEDAFPPKNENLPAQKRAKNADALFPPSEAERRFARAENVLKKIADEPEGVFSFSSLLKIVSDENDAGGRENDEQSAADDEDAVPAESTERNAETHFPKRPFFELPAGAEFGSIVHEIFEKTDFRSRENLDELLNYALPRLPEWTTKNANEKNATRERFRALIEENLSLPLPPDGLRLETLAPGDLLRETEFHFPLKRSKNFYAGLARIFSSWGGIYAETAERLWSNGGNALEADATVAGMMTGVVDLAFRANGRVFILDWKTNAVVSRKNPIAENFLLPESAIREEIVKHAYALQWSIYAIALKKYLRSCLGDAYDHDRDFGGIVYLFVRWCAPYVDSQTLTAARLDELESFLCGNAPHGI